MMNVRRVLVRHLSTSAPTVTTTAPRLAELRSKIASEPPTSSSPVTTSVIGTSSTPTPVDAPSYFIKTYGCQMNVSDTAVVRSILNTAGFVETEVEAEADVNLTNTCAIRDNAEEKVWQRLRQLRASERKAKRAHSQKLSNLDAAEKTTPPPPQVLAVLGCMAERLKTDMFTVDGPKVDVVVGPDAYRNLPDLLTSQLNIDPSSLSPPSRGCDTQLSFTETYAEITPTRSSAESTTAFVSVMRGCNNMCSYCVVPFTRGRERSRNLDSIVDEARAAIGTGVREITLLGQNVNSYHDKSEAALLNKPETDYATSHGDFTNMYKLRSGAGYYFADLVEAVSDLDPEVRVRFTSPHPKDFPDDLLYLVRDRTNVCNQLHMPAQSGSTAVLDAMRRGYSRDAYLELIEHVRGIIPGVALSSDFISGFCGETEQDHKDTLSLIEQVEFDQAFMFAYSMRGKTHAHRKMTDDVAQSVKARRLQEVIETFRVGVQAKNEREELGELRVIMSEGESRRSGRGGRGVQLTGKTCEGKRLVFDVEGKDVLKEGEYGVVRVTQVRGHTLVGDFVEATTLAEQSRQQQRVTATADKAEQGEVKL